MKLRHWITAIALLLLVAAAITGMVWTRALRTAALNPPKLTAEAKEVGAGKAKTDAAVKADQETRAQLTRSHSGHPTGRRGAFVNRFAIEDHCFNFSTSGQWMGDEWQLAIPADQDSYAVVEQLLQLVA
jgi:hypothetical protein